MKKITLIMFLVISIATAGLGVLGKINSEPWGGQILTFGLLLIIVSSIFQMPIDVKTPRTYVFFSFAVVAIGSLGIINSESWGRYLFNTGLILLTLSLLWYCIKTFKPINLIFIVPNAILMIGVIGKINSEPWGGPLLQIGYVLVFLSILVWIGLGMKKKGFI